MEVAAEAAADSMVRTTPGEAADLGAASVGTEEEDMATVVRAFPHRVV